MQAYPNAYPVAGAQPVRYMVPGNYGQAYPPFVNRSYDRFALMPATYRAPAMTRPPYYPPSYGPGYGQGAGPNQPGGNQPAQTKHAPTVTAPKPTVQGGQRPSQGGLYNPNGGKKNSVSSGTGSKTPGLKKGAKEFKDTAFTIEPDGANNEAIRGLVSNDDINNLLKHKGTKVKVSKIYRITKTKPEELSESEDEAPPPPPPKAKAQRPRSPSEDSYCSQCAAEQSHVYDDCPECRAARQVHVYDDCPECRAARQVHTYDDCPQCRAEQEREFARRQSVK